MKPNGKKPEEFWVQHLPGSAGAGYQLRPQGLAMGAEYHGSQKKLKLVAVGKLSSTEIFPESKSSCNKGWEKKFSGKYTVFTTQENSAQANLKKLFKKYKSISGAEPDSHAWCDRKDLVFPSEVIGKRIHIKFHSSQLIKVHLEKGQYNVEHKVETFWCLWEAHGARMLIFISPSFSCKQKWLNKILFKTKTLTLYLYTINLKPV